jgi:hypothetical protein
MLITKKTETKSFSLFCVLEESIVKGGEFYTYVLFRLCFLSRGGFSINEIEMIFGYFVMVFFTLLLIKKHLWK